MEMAASRVAPASGRMASSQSRQKPASVVVLPRLRERPEVAEQSGDVLDVEYRKPHHHAGVDRVVDDNAPDPGDLHPDPLRRDPAVQAVELGGRAQRGQELFHPDPTMRQHRPVGGVAECLLEALPPVDQLARGGVKLAVGAMLGGMQRAIHRRTWPV